VVCGGATSRAGVLYCSGKCRKIDRHPEQVKDCLECGTQHANRIAFCSQECQRNHGRIKRLKACFRCGKDTTNSKYCSSSCSAKHQWACGGEDQERVLQQLLRGNQERWDQRSPQEIEEYMRPLREGKKARRAAMTPEERERERVRLREQARRQWERYSPEQKEQVRNRLLKGTLEFWQSARSETARTTARANLQDWNAKRMGPAFSEKRAISERKRIASLREFYASPRSTPIREFHSKRMVGNNYKNRCIWYEVQNGDTISLVQGTWEKRVAEWLHRCGVLWERHSLCYAGHRRYTPDFYIPTFGIYIEVKGYFPEEAKAKMHKVLGEHKVDLRIFQKEDWPLVEKPFDPERLASFQDRHPV